MGTPAFIGIQNDNRITGVYCHHGQFGLLGPILLQHHNSEEAARAIVQLGNLSHLGDSIDAPATSAYIRDWSGKLCEAVTYQNLAELREENGGRFYFFFIFANGVWNVSEGARFLHPLDDALKQMENDGANDDSL